MSYVRIQYNLKHVTSELKLLEKKSCHQFRSYYTQRTNLHNYVRKIPNLSESNKTHTLL